jgi:hypothetical protein
VLEGVTAVALEKSLGTYREKQPQRPFLTRASTARGNAPSRPTDGAVNAPGTPNRSDQMLILSSSFIGVPRQELPLDRASLHATYIARHESANSGTGAQQKQTGCFSRAADVVGADTDRAADAAQQRHFRDRRACVLNRDDKTTDTTVVGEGATLRVARRTGRGMTALAERLAGVRDVHSSRFDRTVLSPRDRCPHDAERQHGGE